MALGRVVFIGAIAAVVATAHAVDFTAYSQAGTGFFSLGSSFTDEGYNFNLSGSGAMGVWGLSDPSHPVGGAWTTSLLSYDAGDTITMSQAGGGTFGLASIDLAPWGANQTGANFDVTFVGDVSGGGTVQNTFTVVNTATPQLQTFNFTGFTNLVDVHVVEGVYSSGMSWQFDNIVPTPEPSTVLSLGLVGVGLLVRRRQNR